jgi:hypothetical protein
VLDAGGGPPCQLSRLALRLPATKSQDNPLAERASPALSHQGTDAPGGPGWWAAGGIQECDPCANDVRHVGLGCLARRKRVIAGERQ